MIIHFFVREGARIGNISKNIFPYVKRNTISRSFDKQIRKSLCSTGVATAANNAKTIIHTEQRILGKNTSYFAKQNPGYQ